MLLYVAINFTASYSKSFKKSKPYVPPPRAGRLNKSSVNRSCRHHRRQVCGSSGKVSLRQRLRIKSREDMRDRMDYFELNPWSKPHWNKNKRRRGRKRSCARQVHAPSKTFSSHQKLKFNHMLRKSFPEFAFVNTPNVTLHSVRANGLATSFCCGGRGHNKSSCGGRARYGHRSGRTGVSSRQHASDSHRFANVTSNFDCLSSFSSSGKKHETFPLIWDSGASVCVTPNRKDFIDYTTEVTIPTLSGYAKGQDSNVLGEGTVLWSIEDENGMLRTLKLRACHLPQSKHRLIATNDVASTYKSEEFTISANGGRLTGIPGDNSRGSIFVPLNIASKLLVSIGHNFHGSCVPPSADTSSIHAATSSHSSINQNLSGTEKELLAWHERLGHLAFAKVQFLLRTGVLASSEVGRRLHRSAASLKPLKCAACLFAKQRARSIPGRRPTAIVDSRSGILKKNNLLPGQEISVDHFICSQKGRLFNSRGKSADKDMYKGGCIFVDHASNFVHVEFQTVLTSHATLASKVKFENICRDHGVHPQRYLSDNGTAFTGVDFSNHLREFRQTTRFAGVGAHYHNGHAERSIQTIMSISRAMMIHASLHWPDLADSCLWPMAVQHAVFLWNHVPNPGTGLSPNDIFTKTRWNQSKFHDLHVWGCPVYVLDKRIADGNKIPRWKPRSTRCMYLGFAPSYASSVPLVLNPTTGAITPQLQT